MKKYWLILIIFLFVVTGCKSNIIIEEEPITGKDFVTISVEDFKKESLDWYLELIILQNKYRDKLEDVKKYVKNEIEKYKEQYSLMGYSFEEALKDNGYENEDALYDYLYINKLKTIECEDYAKSLITEEEINDYYNNNNFGNVSIRYIYLNDTTEEEAKNTINKLNNGSDFIKLVKEYSEDESTKDKGGLLKIKYEDIETYDDLPAKSKN